MYIGFTLLFTLSFACGLCQNLVSTDSLMEVIMKEKEDRIKAKKYLEHVDIILKQDKQLAMDWNNKALEILEYRKKQKGISTSESNLIDKDLSKAYYNQGYFAEHFLRDLSVSEEYYLKQVEISETAGNKRGIAVTYGQLGQIYERQGQLSKALEMFNKAFDIYSTVRNEADPMKDSLGIVMCNASIASVLFTMGEIKESIERYKTNLQMYGRWGNKQGMARTYNNLAVPYLHLGDIPKAIALFEKGLKIREEMQDYEGIAGGLNNLAKAYATQGEYTEALKYFKQSLELYDKNGNERAKAYTVLNLGGIYNELGDYQKALEYYNYSIKLSKKWENKKALGLVYKHIGTSYLERKKLNLAKAYFDSSLTFYSEINYPQGTASINERVGTLFLLKGSLDKAAKYGKESLKIAQQLGIPKNIMESSELLYHAYEKSGRYKDALRMYELYIQMRDSIVNESNQKAAIQQQMKYEFEKAQLIKEQETKEKRRVLIESIQKNRLWAGIIVAFLVLLMASGMVYYAFQKKKNETLFQELRNQALRLQINPHFLFNAMNAISSFIGKNDAANAKRYLAKFSRIMRLSLESVQSELVTLESEIEFIANYIEIEMIRNKNFEYEIKVDENIPVEDVFMPPILIQPYVENSIVHGFKQKSEEAKGRLQIEFSLVGRDEMKITVEDDGIGIDTKRKEKKHKSLALKITQKRLNAFAKKKVDIQFQKNQMGKGTNISFVTPMVLSKT